MGALRCADRHLQSRHAEILTSHVMMCDLMGLMRRLHLIKEFAMERQKLFAGNGGDDEV